MIIRNLIFCMVGVILTLSGCVIDEGVGGHILSEKRLNRLKEGVSTKQSVISALGSPSIKSAFGNKWHYISKHVEKRAFFNDDITDYQAVTIEFAGDKISKMTRVKNDSLREITPDEARTRTAGREMGVLEQLLGNIGRFNAGD